MRQIVPQRMVHCLLDQTVVGVSKRILKILVESVVQGGQKDAKSRSSRSESEKLRSFWLVSHQSQYLQLSHVTH